MERGGSTYIYLYDGHGSVRGLIDAEGKLTDTYNYDAFGVMLDRTGDTENSYLYCGEQQDDTTGLYYLRARYMNPATGTFTSMDTYGGTVFDPTSLHKYLYANANPVSYTDPSGYVSLGEVVVTSTIIGALTGAAFGAGISILRQLILNPKGKIDWKEVGKAALIGFGLGAAFGLVAGFAKFYLLAASLLVLGQLIFIGIGCYATYIDWENYENGWLLLLDLTLVGLSIFGLTKGVKNLKSVAENAKQTSGASKTAKTSTDPSPENTNTAENKSSANQNGDGNVSKPTPVASNTNSGGTRDIYRAVGPEEYYDIMATNKFRGVEDSLAAKEFGNSFEETLKFADSPINTDKVAIIKVTIPEEMYMKLNHMRLDPYIFKSGTPVVEPEMLAEFNKSIISIEHVF